VNILEVGITSIALVFAIIILISLFIVLLKAAVVLLPGAAVAAVTWYFTGDVTLSGLVFIAVTLVLLIVRR
jgi:hypothetical protein